mgnify:FL=1
MFMIKAGSARNNIVIDIGNALTNITISVIVRVNAIICIALITYGAYLMTKLSGVFIWSESPTCVMVYGQYVGI